MYLMDECSGYQMKMMLLIYAGDDTFDTGLGNDVIDGGSGTDTVKLSTIYQITDARYIK